MKIKVSDKAKDKRSFVAPKSSSMGEYAAYLPKSELLDLFPYESWLQLAIASGIYTQFKNETCPDAPFPDHIWQHLYNYLLTQSLKGIRMGEVCLHCRLGYEQSLTEDQVLRQRDRNVAATHEISVLAKVAKLTDGQIEALRKQGKESEGIALASKAILSDRQLQLLERTGRRKGWFKGSTRSLDVRQDDGLSESVCHSTGRSFQIRFHPKNVHNSPVISNVYIHFSNSSADSLNAIQYGVIKLHNGVLVFSLSETEVDRVRRIDPGLILKANLLLQEKGFMQNQPCYDRLSKSWRHVVKDQNMVGRRSSLLASKEWQGQHKVRLSEPKNPTMPYKLEKDYRDRIPSEREIQERTKSKAVNTVQVVSTNPGLELAKFKKRKQGAIKHEVKY